MFQDIPSDLPPEIPADKLEALLITVEDKCRKLGLYMNAAVVHVDVREDDDDPEPRHHMLLAQFTLGDHAFSKAVQDPEADKFDTEFKKIEHGTVQDQIEEIKRQYRKKDDDQSDNNRE